jgi:hypothetical protein
MGAEQEPIPFQVLTAKSKATMFHRPHQAA